LRLNATNEHIIATTITDRRHLKQYRVDSPTANVRCTWRELSDPSLYTFLPFPDVRQGING